MLCDVPCGDVARAPGRARRGAATTERGWMHRERVAGPRVGDDERARRSGGRCGRRARCRAAGSRRRARRRSSDRGRAETSANVPVWTTAAVLEDDEPIGERGRVERIVGDEQPHAAERRELAAQLAPHRAACALVERGERLVEQQQPRLGGHRPRERDPLRLPARELARLHAAPSRRGRRVRASPSRRVAPRPRPRAPAAEPERDVLEHGEVREQQVVLEHDADRAPLGRHERRGRRRRATTPSSSMRPRSIGTSPASARSNVVLPAPFGPRIATVSPSAGLRARRRDRATRAGARRARARLIRHRASGRAATRAPRRTPRAARCSGRSRPRAWTPAAGRPRAASSACGPGCCRRR